LEAKITKRLADALAPGPKDLLVWDTALKGFGLKVTPSGGRIYVVQYRMGGRGTPTCRHTLGKHGALTPEQARTEAARLLAKVAQGIDPVQEERARLARLVTVSALADRYLDEHAAEKNRASTLAENRRIAERHIKPALGALPVGAVTRDDVARFHHARRATPRQANLALAILSKMFNLAEAWGLRPNHSNPCRLIQRFRERQRMRFLSDAEITALGRVLDESERDGTGAPMVPSAVRLLLLTGCRLGEILALQWADADLAGFHLPTSCGAISEPRAMSIRRAMPRHMTMFPGGGSQPRAR
jgi:hypothetical protein